MTKMRIGDLIRDPSGTMSHFKLWNNIASTVFTWVVVSRELSDKLSEDLVVWYAGMLIAGVLVSKGVSLASQREPGV